MRIVLNSLLQLIVLPVTMLYTSCSSAQSDPPENLSTEKIQPAVVKKTPEMSIPPFDSLAYKKGMIQMANGDSTGKWAFNGHYPKAGALMPFNRIIAYYGNLYSTRMGILGELPKPQMFERLKEEVEGWQKADTSTKAIPALHYIVSTAQQSPGSAGKYRLRMPDKEINKVMAMAEEINALVFLDIQVGLSNLREEIPVLEKYLAHPKVHLGIDPEFSMKGGQKPGTVIGSFDSSDINFATQYLADLVKKYDLPPKVLVVHRFTKAMIKGYGAIKILPEVQIVIDMDGWGAPARKINTYRQFVHKEPVQFTGFKLFYKNDLKEPPHRLLTKEELLALRPVPLYIQYQ